jgi:hypothetical protein
MLPPLVTLQQVLTVMVFDAVPKQFSLITVTLYVPVALTEIDDVVAPLLQLYKLPALPPFAVNTAAPSEKQCVLGPLMLIEGFTQGVHGAITPLPVAVHPLASVTVTVKFPASHNPVIADVVAPLLHMYVNGAVPPVTLAVTLAPQALNMMQLPLPTTLTPTTGTGLIRTRTTFDSPGQSLHPDLRLQRTNQRLLHNS